MLTGYPKPQYLKAFYRWWQIITVSPVLVWPMYYPQYISHPTVQMPKEKAELYETARKQTLQQKTGLNKPGLPFCVHKHLLWWFCMSPCSILQIQSRICFANEQKLQINERLSKDGRSTQEWSSLLPYIEKVQAKGKQDHSHLSYTGITGKAFRRHWYDCCQNLAKDC